MLIALLGLSLFITNMEEKDTSWGDVELYIGGKKLVDFRDAKINTGFDIVVDGEIWHNCNLKDNKIHSYTGTITISKKEAHKLRKLFKLKKHRLPRKLKKKLKKKRVQRIKGMNKNIIEWRDYYFPFGYRPRYLDKFLSCRCYVVPVTPSVSKEYLNRFTADDIAKMIKSFDNQPILPRDPGNRPNFIICDDLE